jgi:hypothetical protein
MKNKKYVQSDALPILTKAQGLYFYGVSDGPASIAAQNVSGDAPDRNANPAISE